MCICIASLCEKCFILYLERAFSVFQDRDGGELVNSENIKAMTSYDR